MKPDPQFQEEIRRMHIADGEELAPEYYPRLDNISAVFFYQFMPRLKGSRAPEYVYVPINARMRIGNNNDTRLRLAVTDWNLAWEAGELRHEWLKPNLARAIPWLKRYEGQNLVLLPRVGFHRYDAFAPLFHLLPRNTLEKFGLPFFRKGVWPSIAPGRMHEEFVPIDFDRRLSSAFAHHIWPLLNSGSPIHAFRVEEPLRLLAHNLDFWLPYAHEVTEDRLRRFPRVEVDDQQQAKRLQKLRRRYPDIEIHRPRCGGTLWCGEEEALAATHEMIERADGDGKLRAIIDAIKSNRVEEDFSARWSFAREDFERKLYHKRLKIAVSFVELANTIPVHGPESEVHETLLWEDFMGMLDVKERRVTVLLRSGLTRVGEISEVLGYANHSPVSKALDRIRRKVKALLN